MAPHSQSGSSDDIYSVPVPDDERDDNTKQQLSSPLSRIAVRRQELQRRRRKMSSGSLGHSSEAESSTKSSTASPWRRPGSQLRAQLLAQDEELSVPEKLPMARCLRVSERVLDQFLQHPVETEEQIKHSYLVGARLETFLTSIKKRHADDSHADEVTRQNLLFVVRQYLDQIALLIDQQAYQDYISSVLADDGLCTLSTTTTSKDDAGSSVLSGSDEMTRMTHITVETTSPEASTTTPSIVTPKSDENSAGSTARSKELGVLDLGGDLARADASCSSSSSDPPMPPSPVAVSPRAEMTPRISNGRWVQRWAEKHPGTVKPLLAQQMTNSAKTTTTTVSPKADKDSESNDFRVLKLASELHDSSSQSSSPPMPPSPVAVPFPAETTPRISNNRRWVQNWAENGSSRPLVAQHMASTKDTASPRYADKRTSQLEQQGSRSSWPVRGSQQVDDNHKAQTSWRDNLYKGAFKPLAPENGNRSVTERASLPLSKEIRDSADNLVSLALSEQHKDCTHDRVLLKRSSPAFWDQSDDEESDSEDGIWTAETAEAVRNDIVSSSSGSASTNKRVVTPTYDIPGSRQERVEWKEKLGGSKTERNNQKTLNNDPLNMNRPKSAPSSQFDMEPPPTAKKDNTQKSSIHQAFDPFETSFPTQFSDEQENSTAEYPFSSSLAPPTRVSRSVHPSQRHLAHKDETRRPESFLVHPKSALAEDYVSSPARLCREESSELWQLWNMEGDAKISFGKLPPREQVAVAPVASNVYRISSLNKKASDKQDPFSSYQKRYPDFDADEESMELQNPRFSLQPFRKCVQFLLD